MLEALEKNITALKAHIRKDEGCPKDDDGNIIAYFEPISKMWHIAYGHLLDAEQSNRELKAMGLDDELDNWEGFTIADGVEEELLDIDIDDTLKMLYVSFDEHELGNLDSVRFISLFSMAYQQGSVVKFPAMIEAIKREYWDRAADEMLWSCGLKKQRRSIWYKQTPERAQKMSDAMRHGNWEGESTETDPGPPGASVLDDTDLSTFSNAELIAEQNKVHAEIARRLDVS